MGNSGPQTICYDITLVPKGWSLEDFMFYWKVTGFLFIDTSNCIGKRLMYPYYINRQSKFDLLQSN